MFLLFLFVSIVLFSCIDNNPYPPKERNQNIYYDTFREEHKHLDPAVSYSSDEYEIISQIYESPLQYHYLKRPYTLEPLTIQEIPKPQKSGNLTIYELKLKPGIFYAHHPAFAKSKDNRYIWHNENKKQFPNIEHPMELNPQGTKELTADDYIYQIKRLANPKLSCPIFPILVKYIDGFDELYQQIKTDIAQNPKAKEGSFLDLRKYSIKGAKKKDKYTFQIILKKPYPQILYWLATPFFAPIPWQLDKFYSQPTMLEKNITLDRFPAGTGPFVMSKYQPNLQIELLRNQNYRKAYYPSVGEKLDHSKGLLKDAGKPIPFLEKIIFRLEKEQTSRWFNFTQGYYDVSGVYSDTFDAAINMRQDSIELTSHLKEKGIILDVEALPSIFYYAFNMNDKALGGYTPEKQKLRHAISIAINIEEFIQIFLNGRGKPAHSPIPKGIFGYDEDAHNPYVYDKIKNRVKRKSLETAKELLKQAGYPNGIGADGKRLTIYFDAISGSGISKSINELLKKQLTKINVDLQFRVTDYNQFRVKMLNGDFQLVSWGWNADYPDPENFFFLFYGPNSKMKYKGENVSNYNSPKFNQLFEQMENIKNSPARKKIIQTMIATLQKDAPWSFGYIPTAYTIKHQWYQNSKSMLLGRNHLKYIKIDYKLREKKRKEWNQPRYTIFSIFTVFVTLLVIVAFYSRYKKDRKN